MSHWDEKKPTRYRAKAGPEVVLRKVSVLFAISSMPKRAIGRRKESFSERTILFALNLLCRKRAIEQMGQSRFEKGTRPFLFIVSALFSYGALLVNVHRGGGGTGKNMTLALRSPKGRSRPGRWSVFAGTTTQIWRIHEKHHKKIRTAYLSLH